MMDTTPEELKKINSPLAQEQMQSRADQQEAHLEEKYGPLRQLETKLSEAFVDHSLLNWILTLHSFNHLKGMDYLNAVNKMFLVHLNHFESKVKKMEAALGSEGMKRLEIDPDMLYPNKVAVKGLLDVQEAARARAKAGKYLKLEKPKQIIL